MMIVLFCLQLCPRFSSSECTLWKFCWKILYVRGLSKKFLPSYIKKHNTRTTTVTSLFFYIISANFKALRPIPVFLQLLYSSQGSFPVRKGTRTLRIWRAREREPMGVWGRYPSGVQGQSPWSGGQGAKLPWSWRHFTAEESKFVTLI